MCEVEPRSAPVVNADEGTRTAITPLLFPSPINDDPYPPAHDHFRWLSKSLIAVLVLSSAAQYYASSVLSLAMYIALDYSPQQTTMYWVYMSWVYWFSPLVGWFSDWFAVCGHRRRPTVIVGAVVSTLAWVGLWIGTINNITYGYFVALSVVATVAQMLITIPLNGIIVEAAAAAHEWKCGAATPPSSSAGGTTALAVDGAQPPLTADERRIMGEIQSRAMLAKSFGSLIGSTVQTLVQIKYDSTRALVGAPVLFLLVIPSVLLLRQRPRTEREHVPASHRLRVAWRTLSTACEAACGSTLELTWQGRLRRFWHSPVVSLCAVLVFVFIYNSELDGTNMYSQYIADNFNFDEWFLSLSSGVALLGSCIGCELYARFIAKRNQMHMFALGCLTAALCYVTRVMFATGFAVDTLKIPAAAFVAVDGFVCAVLSRMAFMPVLHVASERAPAGFEAFIFEMFSVAAIGASTVGAIGTVKLSEKLDITDSNWGNLWKLLLYCAASNAVPLFFAPFLPPPRPRAANSLANIGDLYDDSLVVVTDPNAEPNASTSN
jgi:hypothetical protein